MKKSLKKLIAMVCAVACASSAASMLAGCNVGKTEIKIDKTKTQLYIGNY